MSGSANPNKHPLCAKNRCIKIKGARGSLKLKISDTCPPCKYNDVDMADSLFHLIDDPAKGRVKIYWDFVDCGNLYGSNFQYEGNFYNNSYINIFDDENLL
ncbi:hypothetical protein PVAND_000162 [Polypedilum vanderplanki]|uniref:RlpA-like protein double-psi beta-barrel domain-containing protein n=1 Tax=Polypedilum vanderplanki TaxID=319348 RepID=A0A9J6BJV6_POLVA|nr:hypothetical protein PVAND_000162 [Polypedilum vanderplanki]